MASENLKVKSGNKVVVNFDGAQIGLAQSVDSNDDYAPEPASGIGDIHVQEYVPTMARHTIQVEEMVLKAGSLRTLGVTAENADQMLRGMVFDLVVMGKDDGGVLRKYSKCSYASGSVQVRKHAIVISNATFNALDVSGTGA